MKLVLKNVGGEAVSLQIKPEETFLELKDRVEAELGVTLDLKVIAIKGRKIIETQKVVDYFLTDKCEGSPEPTQNVLCSVPGCTNSKCSTPDRCFFKFPEEEVRCHQWVLYCQRLNMMSGKHRLNLTSDSYICSDHFRPDQFVKNTSTLLKRTAVPCTNPELPISDSTLKRSSVTTFGKCELVPATTHSISPNGIAIDPTLLSIALSDVSLITLLPTDPLHLGGQISYAVEPQDPTVISNDSTFKCKTGLSELPCRLCAMMSDSYIFIFDSFGESLGLEKMINDCLPIEVKPTDHLPKQICKDCFVKLSEVHVLAETSLQSDAKFSQAPFKDGFVAEELYTFPVNLLHNCFSGVESNTSNLCSKIYGCPLCNEGKMSTVDSTTTTEPRPTPEPTKGSSPSTAQSTTTTSSTTKPPSSTRAHSPSTRSSSPTGTPMTFTVDPPIPSGVYIQRDQEPVVIENENTSSCGSFLNTEFTGASTISYAFVPNQVTVKDIDEILNKPLNVDLSFELGNCSPMFDSSESISLDGYKQSNIEFVNNKSPSAPQNADVDSIRPFSDDLSQDKSLLSLPSTMKSVTTPRSILPLERHGSSLEEDPLFDESSKQTKMTEIIPRKIKYPHHCEACGLRFKKASTMLHHGCLEPLASNNKCYICYKSFRSAARLLFHIKFHDGAKPGFCDICRKSFPDETKLYKHTLYLHGGEKTHCCEECGKVFRSISSLRYHQRTHLGESIMKPFSCDQCGKCFIRKSMLKNHITAVHHFSSLEECCFTCKVCFEAFPATDLAVAHMERNHIEESAKETYSFDMHSVNRLYTCEYCDRCFAEGASLNKHRDKHSAETPYQCKSCGSMFSSFAERGNHNLEVHLDSQPLLEYSASFSVPLTYLCEFCDRCFSNYRKFSEHLTIHFGNEPYTCRYCSVKLASLSEAIDHRSSHSEAQEPTEEYNFYRPYECHYCDKSFAIEDALVKHIRMHTGEKPFICDQCGKGFSQSSGLYTHQKVHSNIRPYMCDVCPRTFKIKGDRDVHVRKHSGDRPYKCEFCGKAFMTQHVYSQHRKIHTGERPYKCDVCGIAFRRSHVLTVHKRIHTGEKPNVCDVCGKRYRQKGDMLKHRRVQHGLFKVQLLKVLPKPISAA